MKVTFRRAGPDDIDIVAALNAEYFTYDHIRVDEDEIRRCVAELLGSDAFGRVWLILGDERVIGYTIATFGYDVEVGGRLAVVTDLYVIAECRGQGVGTQTLAFVEQALRELGILAYELSVERANTAARRLYEKVGLEPHDRIPMSKRLGR